MECTPGLFVGDDAHIVPCRGGSFPWEVEWGNVIHYPIPPPHSTYCGGSVRFRDDVGIVPYIRVKLRTTQRTLHQSRFFWEAVEFLGLPLFRGCRLGGGDVSPAADIALTRLI